MRAATAPRPSPLQRLLRVDPTHGTFEHHRVDDLPALLRPGDLLVVNDAATLPASLGMAHQDAELRLVKRGTSDAEWTAILFGAGDFRTATEQRGPSPRVRAGE